MRRLPKQVGAQLSGRPLAWARTETGWVAGTRTEFVSVPDDAEAATVVLGWEQIEAADWVSDESRLTVSEVGSYGEPRATHVFTLDEPGRILELVRERVTASVVLQRWVPVADKRGLRVIGRRSPAGGPVAWMHEYDEAVDPADPEVEAVAEQALAAARADVGDSI